MIVSHLIVIIAGSMSLFSSSDDACRYAKGQKDPQILLITAPVDVAGKAISVGAGQMGWVECKGEMVEKFSVASPKPAVAAPGAPIAPLSGVIGTAGGTAGQ